MCQRCNYFELIRSRGIEPTANRLKVMETIGSHASPMGAPDIFRTVARTAPINRVTVYRILDLLVEKALVERMGGAGRGRIYGLAPNENHPVHPHFSCQRCGTTYCLEPLNFGLDAADLHHSPAGEIIRVDIRISGVCKRCLRRQSRRTSRGSATGRRPGGGRGHEKGC
jgi:Fur family ferric uptake transcriptional regulator